MLMEIIQELNAIRDKTTVKNEQVLEWSRQVETQRTQMTILDSLRKTKDFDMIKSGRVEQKIKTIC